MGLRGAIAVNMTSMIGVGPFMTIPLIIAAMAGPQAMLGWVLGAGFAMCDGLIWAELGAAFPGAGGSYRYLSEAFGPRRWGRLFSFLFVWQFSFSAPLEMASGCLGFAMYATYFFPRLDQAMSLRLGHLHLPGLGTVPLAVSASGVSLLAAGSAFLAIWLAYRNIERIGRISQFLWIGVLATTSWVIWAGMTHFDAHRAFSFPAHAFTPSESFFLGLGSAMLIAVYDYWGYYSVGFLGGEIERPGRNIPRAIIWSIVLVSLIYIVMNVGVLGVLPWQELASGTGPTQAYAISVMMQRVYGVWAAKLVALLIMFTAFASVFSLLLGDARVPYAAALDGNYFKSFAHLHPRGRFPDVSMLWLGAAAALFCFFSLMEVIAALVVIRIALQFLLQAVGLIVLRVRRPELPRPFKVWWYPAPVIAAIAGFVYILAARNNSSHQLFGAAAILLVGMVIYGVRELTRRGPLPPAGADAPDAAGLHCQDERSRALEE